MSISNGILGYLGLGVGAASTTMGAYGAYQEAQAARDAANYNANIQEQNAAIKDIQAQQALKMGEHDIAKAKEEGYQKIETQRASYAASGVKVDSGSALDVVVEQAGRNQYDQSVIKFSADMSAWGLNADASNLRQQAAITRATGKSISPGYAAASSLLGGTTSLLNQYRQYTF